MSDLSKLLRELLEEQELCRNRLGDTEKYPDIGEQYLATVSAINAMASVTPPTP